MATWRIRAIEHFPFKNLCQPTGRPAMRATIISVAVTTQSGMVVFNVSKPCQKWRRWPERLKAPQRFEVFTGRCGRERSDIQSHSIILEANVGKTLNETCLSVGVGFADSDRLQHVPTPVQGRQCGCFYQIRFKTNPGTNSTRHRCIRDPQGMDGKIILDRGKSRPH